MPNQLANVTTDTILELYYSDCTTASIAKKFNVSPQALGKHLRKHAPQEWVEAQLCRAYARKDQAEDDLQEMRSGKLVLDDGTEIVVDSVSVSLARERLKAAQWELEKTCQRFGQVVQIEVREPERDITQVARRLAFLLAKGIDAGEVVAEVVTIEQTPSIESDTPK